MKFKVPALLALACSPLAQASDIVITGVIDGPLSGGTPKAVELFVVNDIPDLSSCGLGSANNGGGTDNQEFTFGAVAASAGTYIYVASESPNFTSYLGFAPDYTSGAMAINGDDAIELFCGGAVVDVFGDINTDGSGQPWEYLDGWSYRKSGTTADGNTFNIANWDFSGRNALDGETSNDTAASPFPLQTFAEGSGGSGGSGGGSGGSGGTGLEGVCFNCPDLSKIADATTFDDAAYYAAAITEVNAGSSAAVIKDALNTIISQDHRVLTYAEVWTALTETDEDPANSDNVILFYKGTSLAKLSNGSGAQSSDPDNWNREHSWPKSHGFSSDSFEAHNDIHHLRPTDISVNSSRGNLDFDNSDNPLAEAPLNRVDGDSFEPRDEVKGDVARMMFYMDTRYEGLGSDVTPDLTLVDNLTSTGTSELGRLCRLIEWHNGDPVSAAETERHNTIYEYQGNRNPFVDHPEWVATLYTANACGDTGGGSGGGSGGGTGGGTGGEGSASDAGAILITEVLQNPSAVSDSNGEWFEIVNSGIAPVNLNGWTVRDDDNDSFVIDQDVILFPGEYAIIGNNSDVAANGGVAVDYAYGSQMFLSNSSDELVLEDTSGAIVDEIAWDGGPVWPDPNGASMTLVDFSGDNNDGTKWQAEPTETFGNGDRGTPGTSGATFALVITEIMQNPSAVSDSAGEWFEVLNTGAIAVNLNGWTLRDDDSDSHLVTADAFVAPGTYAVFANNADSATNGGVDAVYEYGSMFLSNGSDELVLQRPDGTIEDQVNWDNGATFPDPNGRSMTLTSAFVDNSIGANWFAEDTQTYGDGDYGTPGTGPDGSASGGDDGGTGGTVELGLCADPATLIHTIQGNGSESLLVGEQHVVEAVVTGVFTELGGFFVQEQDSDADADSSTSEGLFIAYSAETSLPQVNDVVRAVGTVEESFGKTQLAVSDSFAACGTGSVTASVLSLPFASTETAESLEGMLVISDGALTVNDTYNLGRYGEVSLSNGRRYIPTNLHAPGSPEAVSLADVNSRNTILLDDGVNGSNPEQVVYPTGGLSASNTLRSGDTVTSLTGVVDYSFSNYRVIPTQAPTFAQNNVRTDAPDLDRGNVTVASLNVLNLFNGDGQGAGFPTSRGANTIEEFERQIAKTVAAIAQMDADIVGLMEIENDGFGDNSTIMQLTQRLNAVMGEGTYSVVNVGGPLGTDAIAVALIYKSAVVEASGSPVINEGAVHNRPPLAQTFVANNGAELTVVVNHFKSKGCGGSSGADADQADGQGCYNATRVAQAQDLMSWLASDEALSDKPNKLIIGDLNSYAQEDPIVAIENSGFTNVIESIGGAEAYSYVFGGEFGYLDHALASESLMAQLIDATEWHINADEPRVLDYNVENKSAQQLVDFYAADAYRVSDHDPVLVSFDLTADNSFADLDGDSDIDLLDIRALMLAISRGEEIDPAFDLNNDGAINSLDISLMRGLCTRNRCSTR